ncbi:MAG: hypothetical protein II718_00945, partial [Clostridiales bacterium]|nr:hypothetical protein [Clostridiales bacterium]
EGMVYRPPSEALPRSYSSRSISWKWMALQALRAGERALFYIHGKKDDFCIYNNIRAMRSVLCSKKSRRIRI